MLDTGKIELLHGGEDKIARMCKVVAGGRLTICHNFCYAASGEIFRKSEAKRGSDDCFSFAVSRGEFCPYNFLAAEVKKREEL
jgi:hypothetical protein